MKFLKQSTTRNNLVFMTSSTDHVTGVAGATLTITLSKDGAAFSSISPTVTDLGSGWYNLALTTGNTDTLGDIALHVTATGCDPSDLVAQVVLDLPGATVSSVTGNVSGNVVGSVASVTGNLGGNVVGSVASVTGNVGGNVVGTVASVVGAVGSVTGNVGGNVVGTVASVVGAVGSVTGNVGGNVTGTVASVVGNVGGNVTGTVASVVGNVGGNVTGSVGSVLGNVAGSVASVVGNIGGNLVGSVGSLSSTAVSNIWDALTSGISTSSSIGKLIIDNLNATITSVKALLPSALVGGRIDASVGAYQSGSVPLQPTVAGRTLDVTATGEAGIDWANIGAPTTTQNLSGTTVSAVSGAVGSVSGAVASVTGNVGGSVASVVGNVGGNVTGSVASVVAGVTVTTNNDKSGYALSSAGVQAIWDALTSALTTVGSIGKLLVTNINATISSVAGSVWDVTLSGHLNSGSTGAALNAAGSAGDPWTTSLPGAYGAGTAGNILGNNLDAAISTRLATSGYTAPANSNISAIKAQTDQLTFTGNNVNADTKVAEAQIEIKKNMQLTSLVFPMTDSTNHAPITGIVPLVQISIAGASLVNSTNPASEIGGGLYKVTLTASEMNGNNIGIIFSGAGADTRFFTLPTQA